VMARLIWLVVLVTTGSAPAVGAGSRDPLYGLRSTYATRLSAGGVADKWVTQLLRGRRQGVQEVFADGASDETRGAPEAESVRERKWSSGTGGLVLGQFGRLWR
jgi:hypothetical protein